MTASYFAPHALTLTLAQQNMAHMGAVKNEEFKAGEVIMSSDAVRASEKCGKDCWVWLALIVAAAAFFRLYDLGMSAFRADTILLWELAKRHVAPALLFTDWFEVSGAAGQMPMPAFIMQLFLSLTGWHVTPAMVRFPFAFFGLLAVPVAFFAGRRISGPGFGLMLAAFLAVNSFHIATCREAYFYSTLIFGAFLFLLAAAGIVPAVWEGRAIRISDFAILAVALFFSAYSQITGLILCVAGGLLFLALLIYKQRRTALFKKNTMALVVVYGIVLLPVLAATWGLRPILGQIGANKENSAKVVSMSGESLFTGVTKALLQFGWGWSVVGWVVFALALIGAVYWAVRGREKRWLWIFYFVIMQIAIFGVLQRAMAATYEARYLAGVFPFFLALLVYGLWGAGGQLKKTVAAKALAGCLCGGALVAAAYPAYLQTQLTGKPTPYFDLVRWFDTHLPPGTPVLVDRWFEPWNELKSHPSTNVVFTFTIPNEPVDVFMGNHWRDTAKDFFVRNPDAAYLEIAKEYWDVPGVGAWDWPRQFFARHATIANEAGLKLRALGLANRSDFYAANTNRVVVEVFYNTTEDVIEQARRAGRPALVLFGSGWIFTKTQDFRDWRIPQGRANLEVYNLTGQPMEANLLITAASVSGSKQVDMAGQMLTFEGGRLLDKMAGPVTLVPGRNSLAFSDRMWDGGRAPLLVATVDCRPVVRADDSNRGGDVP